MTFQWREFTSENQRQTFSDQFGWASKGADVSREQAFLAGWEEAMKISSEFKAKADLWDNVKQVALCASVDWAGYRFRERIARHALNFILGDGNLEAGAKTKIEPSSK